MPMIVTRHSFISLIDGVIDIFHQIFGILLAHKHYVLFIIHSFETFLIDFHGNKFCCI